MNRQLQEKDDEFEIAQAKHAEIRRAEDKARIKLGEARSRYEREKSMLARAQKKEAEVQGSEREARRRKKEAERRGDEARRKGLAQHRYIAESRQWNSEANRLAENLLRWQEDVRRKDREVRTKHTDVKDELAEVADLVKGAHVLELRMKFLLQNPGRRLPVAPSSDGIVRPLAVPGRATSVLRDMLDGMEHGPDQALRLAAGPDGSIALSLDTQRAGDNVVSHEGNVVLLIGSPVPGTLQGGMLDISETPGGPTIVLSR